MRGLPLPAKLTARPPQAVELVMFMVGLLEVYVM